MIKRCRTESYQLKSNEEDRIRQLTNSQKPLYGPPQCQIKYKYPNKTMSLSPSTLLNIQSLAMFIKISHPYWAINPIHTSSVYSESLHIPYQYNPYVIHLVMIGYSNDHLSHSAPSNTDKPARLYHVIANIYGQLYPHSMTSQICPLTTILIVTNKSPRYFIISLA